MNILLCGYSGHMGREVINLANASSDIIVTGGVDPMAKGESPVPVSKSSLRTGRYLLTVF